MNVDYSELGKLGAASQATCEFCGKTLRAANLERHRQAHLRIRTFDAEEIRKKLPALQQWAEQEEKEALDRLRQARLLKELVEYLGRFPGV